MPTSNKRLPKAAAPAYAAPAPSTRSRPLSRLDVKASVASSGHDLDARRALIARFASTVMRTIPQATLCRGIMELQAAGATLTRPQAHLGRALLADLTAELERRQARAMQQPVTPVPVKAGGYSAHLQSVQQDYAPRIHFEYR